MFMYGKREKVGKQLKRKSVILSCGFVELVLQVGTQLISYGSIFLMKNMYISNMGTLIGLTFFPSSGQRPIVLVFGQWAGQGMTYVSLARVLRMGSSSMFKYTKSYFTLLYYFSMLLYIGVENGQLSPIQAPTGGRVQGLYGPSLKRHLGAGLQVKNIIWVPQSATHAFIIIILIKTGMWNLKPKENMPFFSPETLLILTKEFKELEAKHRN